MDYDHLQNIAGWWFRFQPLSWGYYSQYMESHKIHLPKHQIGEYNRQSGAHEFMKISWVDRSDRDTVDEIARDHHQKQCHSHAKDLNRGRQTGDLPPNP
jgi:hypothetical protein